MALDPRIGILNDGTFYAFANGYDQPEVRGTLEQVEVALGLRAPPKLRGRLAREQAKQAYVAEVAFPEGGVARFEVRAVNKTEARREVRRAYREETPAPSCGYFAFEECRLRWVEEEG